MQKGSELRNGALGVETSTSRMQDGGAENNECMTMEVRKRASSEKWRCGTALEMAVLEGRRGAVVCD